MTAMHEMDLEAVPGTVGAAVTELRHGYTLDGLARLARSQPFRLILHHKPRQQSDVSSDWTGSEAIGQLALSAMSTRPLPSSMRSTRFSGPESPR
jgi:hypothetical protein